MHALDRGEYTKISQWGRGSGRSGTASESNLNDSTAWAGRRRRLVDVGAQRRPDEGEEGAEAPGPRRGWRWRRACSRPTSARSSADARRPRGPELRVEQLDERTGHVGVGRDAALDVPGRERDPGLAKEVAVGPEQRRLPPRELGGEDELVVPVALRASVPGRLHGVDHPAARGGRRRRGPGLASPRRTTSACWRPLARRCRAAGR